MEKEEKLCIKILQTLREMLEKKDSFVEEVYFLKFLVFENKVEFLVYRNWWITWAMRWLLILHTDGMSM